MVSDFGELEDLKKALEIACCSKRGVRPGYGYSKVLKLLLLLEEREPLGRHVLSRELSLGEASVRTLVKRLREGGYVNVDRVGGCILTDLGRRAVRQLRFLAPAINEVTHILNKLTLDRYAYAVRLRIDVGDVAKARDEIIRCGASAALLLKNVDGKLIIPPGSIGEDEYPELARLRTYMGVEKGEWVVVVYANSRTVAENSLLEWLARLVLA